MFKIRVRALALGCCVLLGCQFAWVDEDPWASATVYFLLIDRFHNAKPSNDQQYSRKQDAAVLRSFLGGDIEGIRQRIESGYFNKLGVTAIWMTPFFEQIHGPWDEDWGRSYPFHGYWIKDWTTTDPNFGSKQELKNLVDLAHKHGIRILADVVLNHTGPPTSLDPAWPDSWIRHEPACQWKSFSGNVDCVLSPSIPDIRTDTKTEVTLPPWLLEKWKKEGRLQTETAKLDAFFKRSGLPRYPHNFIISWLSDWVAETGIDGFRVDTAKHVEPEIWPQLREHASAAFEDWKRKHPAKVIDDTPFYMLGEVYNFGPLGFRNTPENTRDFDFGDRVVDFYDFGFDSLINMGFASHAQWDYEKHFSAYAHALNNGPFKGVTFLNYLVSHDDPDPFDRKRQRSYEAANKLLLSPGQAQIYYGDESARPLEAAGSFGDANLRAFMNWQDHASPEGAALLSHWQKLGQFRARHPAIARGLHQRLHAEPYAFSRVWMQDKVVVVIDYRKNTAIDISKIFPDAEVVRDAYSGKEIKVKKGYVKVRFDQALLLLE